jgi:hypothetical protein
MAFLPVGYAIVGPLATWLSADVVLIGGAVLLAVSLVVLLHLRTVRAH